MDTHFRKHRFSARMELQVIGYLPQTDGPGFPTITGDGRHFTMATGFMMMAMAGCGYRDTTGAPAWVTWGEYGGNYCWAPIGPNIQIGDAWSSYRPPAYYWTFLPRSYITRSNMSSHYIHYNTNVTIINNITVINKLTPVGGRGHYMRGLRPATWKNIPMDPLSPRYRPRICTSWPRSGTKWAGGHLPSGDKPKYRRTSVAPARVQSLQSVKPASLPGYNHNVRPGNKPAEEMQAGHLRASRPSQNSADCSKTQSGRHSEC